MTRVVITGVGCISAMGRGKAATWAAAMDGRSRIEVKRIATPDGSVSGEGPVATVLDDSVSVPDNLLEDKSFKLLDRFCKLAVIGAADAIADAGLKDAGYDPDQIGIIFGSSTGGLTSMEEAYFRVFAKGSVRVHPMSVPRFMGSGPASAISLAFGITGPAWCVSSACASSAHAIAEAVYMIKAGRAKAVITGGTEASVTCGNVLAWQAMGALASDTCRPFSAGRTGMALAEGAAALVLEDFESARLRGAPMYGEIVGCGASSDAFHLTQPKTEGAVKAIVQALRESGLSQSQRFLVSTHGTGTPLNDSSEAAALSSVFGDALDKQVAIATKSNHGHLLGGTGALELVLGVLALNEGQAPPLCNYLGPDPACALPLVLDAPQPIRDFALLSNSFAFGGLNSVLVVARA